MEQCAICHTKSFLYPAGCSDNHVACILCLKGITLSKSPPKYGLDSKYHSTVCCPFCGEHSPSNYYSLLEEHVEFIKSFNIQSEIRCYQQNYKYLWLYQGRNNGWWLFNNEMQKVLTEKMPNNFKWLICGQTMEYNFKTMKQCNTQNGNIRLIKRIPSDKLSTVLVKGISGMK